MNKVDLINAVVEQADLTKKETGSAAGAVLESAQSSFTKGGKIQLVGFSNFKVHRRAVRKGRSPRIGKEIDIPASRVPALKAGRALKDAVK